MLFQEKLSEFWPWVLRVCTQIQAESRDLNYLILYIYTSLLVGFWVIYERKRSLKKKKKVVKKGRKTKG